LRVILIFLLFSTLVASPLATPSPPTSAFRGNPTTITVQLKGQTGNPIDNATVYFYHETHNELLDTAITNATGYAQYTWMIPFTHELGPIQLNATFRGDPERYLLPSMVPIPFTIFGQIQNNVNITDENGDPVGSQVPIGQNLRFHTLITDDNSDPLSSITVQLILEPDTVLVEQSTPLNGSLTFHCILNQTAESVYIFTIKSRNLGYLNGTETSFQFSIRNFSVQFFGLPMFWHPSSGYSLQGKLGTTLGQGIPNASIELLLDSGIVLKNTQTENDGRFLIDLYDISEAIQRHSYLILQYNGAPGQSKTRFVIRIIASSPYNPFTQSLEPTTPILHPIFFQISIIAVSCLTAGTSLQALRMRRSTKRVVSH
jgi:hypothetical protein